MRIVTLMLCLAALPASAIDFRGVPMGADEATLLKAAPFLKCASTAPGSKALGDRQCVARYKGASAPSAALYAGVAANYRALFYAGKLHFIRVDIEKSDATGVTAALEQKFGAPKSTSANGKVVEWIGDGVRLTFESDYTGASVTYGSSFGLAEYQRRSEERAKQRAKGL